MVNGLPVLKYLTQLYSEKQKQNKKTLQPYATWNYIPLNYHEITNHMYVLIDCMYIV